MEIKDLQKVVEILRNEGYSDGQIVQSFAHMYLDGKFTLLQFKAVIACLGVNTLPGFQDLNEKEMKKHLAKYWNVKK